MRRHLITTGLALATLAAPAAAQLPSASAAASGLGENFTALARGVHAAAWNPAGLGMPGNPGFQLSILGLRTSGGFDPVGMEAVAKYSGVVLPESERERWMASIDAAGRQRMEGSFGATPIALSIGRLGFALGAEVQAHGDIAPDAAELLLFGNAGRTGNTRDLSFAGTEFLGTAVTTAALSWAQPLRLGLGPLPDQHFAIGVTAKLIRGVALVHGRDHGGSASSAPLEVSVDFPIVQSDTGDFAGDEAGSGFGLDLGASWKTGPWTASLVLMNAVNTFEWNVDDMYFRAGQARFDADSSWSSFDSVQTMQAAPQSVRDEVLAMKYARVLAVGGAWTLSKRLTLVADARQRLGEGRMNVGPKTHVGVGAELRPLGFLPIRLGAASMTDGYRLSGGLGVELGLVNVTASAGRQFGSDGSSGLLAAGLSFGGR